MADPSLDTDGLQDYKKMLDEARTGLEPARVKSQIARDYYDGEQLTSKQRSTLRRRKQPETIRNRIGPAIDGILGILEQAKVDPRAYPRNPQDEEASDVATKCLQYVAEKNRFHKVKIDVADNHLVEGAGAVIVQAEKVTNANPKPGTPAEDFEVTINQIRFDEFFYDPYSRQADYSDARYMGVAKWMYAKDVAAIYPDYAEDILSVVNNTGSVINADMTWDDKPDSALPWIDRKARRIMVVEMYHREAGRWMRCVFCAAGVLDKSDSPYVDERGDPICPIEASSCFIDREMQRYGVARRMLSLQDELNARASRSLHLFNSRQLQVIPNQIPDVDAATARSEAARADGLIPEGYQVVNTSEMGQGNLAIMQEVSSELNRLAPTPAILGRADGANQSGRSRLVLQQAGMTEIARPLGRLEDWENRVYRQAWLRIRQFWTDQKFIRVTNDEGAPEFLQINEPIYLEQPKVDQYTGEPFIDPTTGEPEMEKVMQPQPVPGPDGQPQIDPMTGQPVMQMAPVQTGIDNRVADMDMDIVVDTVPDTANLAAEQFETLAKLAQVYGPEAVSFEDMVEISSLPEKRKFREKREKRQQEAGQAQTQMQQAALEAQMAKAKADVAETESKVVLNQAKAKEIDAGILVDAADMTARAMGGGQMPQESSF